MKSKRGDDQISTIAAKRLADFDARRRLEEDRLRVATDSEYWVCLCFETREQKTEFLAKIGLEGLGDKHVNGLLAAERLGVTIESPRAEWATKEKRFKP